MADRFTGTMLLPEQDLSVEQANKALLDLLKKTNEVDSAKVETDVFDSSVSGITTAATASTKGYKRGLDIVYVSSDLLKVKPGACEINGDIVELTSDTSIPSTMANFPAAGSWAYVTLEKSKTIRLFPATGAATVRPSDNCFQLTGGGIGYDDLKKFHYYYDPLRVIIGAIHKVNATTWYIINCWAFDNESGRNGNGKYIKNANGVMMCYVGTIYTAATVGNVNVGTYGWSFYYAVAAPVWTFPVPFLAGYIPAVSGMSLGSLAELNALSETAATIALISHQSVANQPLELMAIERWK
jgi:hypothetical protein